MIIRIIRLNHAERGLCQRSQINQIKSNQINQTYLPLEKHQSNHKATRIYFKFLQVLFCGFWRHFGVDVQVLLTSISDWLWGRFRGNLYGENIYFKHTYLVLSPLSLKNKAI